MSDDIVFKLGLPPDEDPYLQLGRAIAGQCPAGFEEARLEAELGEDGAKLQLACTPEGGGETRPAIDQTAHGRIQALLEHIRDKDERGWRTCTVTLRKGGGFAMDVRD
jgi:hypothetical protein